MMQRRTTLYLALAATILIWGNSFVLVGLALDDGASPMMIAMGRFVVASAIFGAYILWKRPKWPERSDLRTFIYLAFVGVGVYYFFQYYGVKFAGPSISAILVTLLCPVVIFLLSRSRLGERMNSRQKTGLGIATVGSFLVITDGSFSFVSNGTEILGGLFGVVCAVFWAIFTVEGKRVVTKYEPFTSTAFVSLIGTVMMAPLAVAEIQLVGPVEFPLTYFLAVIYLGVLCTLVGYVLWFKALTGLSASATGASLYFEPLVTVVFAYIILGQGLGWIAALGGVLVAIGVLSISRS
jgi:drug/metabolite transporter (DMT)-like permease